MFHKPFIGKSLFQTVLNRTPNTLKETSTLKENWRLIVGNTVLFQISVESPAMRHQGQAKQGLPITYICF